MRTRALVATAAAALTAVAIPAAAGAGAAGAAGAAWVPTAGGAQPLQGLTDLGAVTPSAPMRVTVAMALRDRPGLDRLVAARQTVTPEQFAAKFAPTPATVDAVSGYLQRSGFTGLQVSPNRTLLTATASAAQAESAFATTLHRVSVAGRSAVANVTPVQVPATLGVAVTSVLGLNTVGAMRVHANPPSSCSLSGVGYPCTYNPQGFQIAYDATGASTGASTPIAVFTEGDLTPVVADLRTEESANGLPQVPVSIVQTGAPSTDTSGASEWDMDTQYSTGMAQSVSQLYLYNSPTLSDPDLTAAFNTFVTQDVAKAASASFGECEFQAQLDGSLAADDQIFAQAAAQGQTVFASAGDTGGFCPVGPAAVNGVPLGAPDVNYPASSPYVVAVGGTTLVTGSGGAYQSEAAWTAGGGGPSLFEKAGPWQTSPLSAVTRTLPDIAMAADPNSGANVYINGVPTGVGGTSLSSPLALGVWARLQSAGGNHLGFAAPLLYGAPASAFHDVVLGDTGPYPAAPGYDLATGIGSIDVAKAQAAIG